MIERKILIVDDEQEICQLVGMYLENSGYSWDGANNGESALLKISQSNYDLLILDIMMPIMDGWTLCKKIRETSNVPVIFLTAKGEEWDKVNGLKMGADDYIVKPFSPGELIARVDAVLRRTKNTDATVLQIGQIKINEKSRNAFVSDKPLSLTLKEYDLLLFFCKHQDHVFSREQILEKVWGFDYFGTARTVDTHIKTLRIKLGQDADYISTVWGVGYKFGING
ncbi:response regulator transcription factor [Bacillus sp. UNCCL81]|jgi:DNA-binding response OmpR family regulator|uniref:response regulator transcription factor n=1 Tax=Bacillus sp. UNCCL81 TaxID=1502755 RepID=UPI0008E6617B|nr:response regulator transcription factor [Bacillus sp. UNCCL81]SFD24156.1 DNA-binding response regulator, OmpR family, contains REC and winged-helix (wHTH) domain [Bacillus sp. UNCCL81]